MESLSEAEIDSLIGVYQSIYDYENALNEVAEAANPAEFKKTRDKYNKEILDAELEYADRLEQAQQEADERLTESEKKGEEEVDSLVADSKKKFQEINYG